MRFLPSPDFTFEKVFEECAKGIQNVTLRENVKKHAEVLAEQAKSYDSFNESSNLSQIQAMSFCDLPPKTLENLYKNQLLKKKEPRKIYDEILSMPKYGICPFCSVRMVSTLDHFFPKKTYEQFTVTPRNLVACCRDCNSEKNISNRDCDLLHPYIHKVEEIHWLGCRISESLEDDTNSLKIKPTFFVNENSGLNQEVLTRLKTSFHSLKIDNIYGFKAIGDLISYMGQLKRVFENGGIESVREELKQTSESASIEYVNHWKNAFYRSLSESDLIDREEFYQH